MKKRSALLSSRHTVAAIVAAVWLSAPNTGFAQNAQAVLKRAAYMMGADGLKTLRYAGTGLGASYGQAYRPGGPWPMLNYSSYVRELDYDVVFTSERVVRSRAEPTGGGAVPLVGNAPLGAVASAQRAWNLTNEKPTPRQSMLANRHHDLWITPHGVIKAAAKVDAKLAFRTIAGRSFATISFALPGVMTATAFLNENFFVERVESRVFDAVLGDTPVVTTYSNYREFSGVNFPTRIEQRYAGAMTLQLTVAEVQANLTINPSVPESVARVTAENVTAEIVAEGVWLLAGGSHNSVAIEMSDHIVLVEAPLGDERAQAVIAATRKLIPGKPLRYVVNSHHHFDHAGGLRAAVAAGATIVTHVLNKPYFARAFGNPNRIAPDALATVGRKPAIIGVNDQLIMKDPLRTVAIHHLRDPLHTSTFLMVHLPKEKLLIEADAFTPPAPAAPPPQPANDYHVNLVQNIDRLKLAVERIVPLHGRVVPVSELYRMVGD